MINLWSMHFKLCVAMIKLWGIKETQREGTAGTFMAGTATMKAPAQSSMLKVFTGMQPR
jgi:hypothetical protein